MALAEKKIAPVDVATIALWRVAENGNVEDLAELLPRVRDIDACNEHGVTALMRAAQNGRVKMEVGVAKGKKLYDKRETEMRRTVERETRAQLKERSNQR